MYIKHFIMSNVNTPKCQSKLNFYPKFKRNSAKISSSDLPNPFKMARRTSNTKSLCLESTTSSQRDKDNNLITFEKFKPSFYSKIILAEILPQDKSVSRHRICSLLKTKSQNSSAVSLGSSKNKIRHKSIIDEKEEFAYMTTKDSIKSKTKTISLRTSHSRDNLHNNNGNSRCHHQNQEKLIEQFLSPVNSFISKDFKLNLPSTDLSCTNLNFKTMVKLSTACNAEKNRAKPPIPKIPKFPKNNTNTPQTGLKNKK